MTSNEPLQPGCYYHLYNRGNNHENLFLEERNYDYFLRLYFHHLHDILHTYAFSLLPGHFHFLVRTVEDPVCDPSRRLSNLFNAYTKTINSSYGRTGSLFQKPFGRRLVSSDADFLNLVFYIHFNPQKHGFVDDFRKWRWTSFKVIDKYSNTLVQSSEVLGWFGSLEAYRGFHLGMVDEFKIRRCLLDG